MTIDSGTTNCQSQNTEGAFLDAESNLLIVEDENGTKVFIKYDALKRPRVFLSKGRNG